MLPWRAAPVPFWRLILILEPRTSPRVLVLALPARRFASWARRACRMTARFGVRPNTRSSASMVSTSSPWRLCTGSFIAALFPSRLSDADQAVDGARDRPFEHQEPAGRVALEHLQVLHRHPGIAHVTGHVQAFPYPSRRRPGPDGARRPGAVGRAVGLRPAVKVVALDAAGKALALRSADHVDQLALLEDLRAELLADLVLRRVVHPHLLEVSELPQALHGVVQALSRPHAELDGVVAVLLLGLDLDDDAGRRVDDSHRPRLAFLREDLRHANLSPEDRVRHAL